MLHLNCALKVRNPNAISLYIYDFKIPILKIAYILKFAVTIEVIFMCLLTVCSSINFSVILEKQSNKVVSKQASTLQLNINAGDPD